jgi:hypothetical protein
MATADKPDIIVSSDYNQIIDLIYNKKLFICSPEYEKHMQKFDNNYKYLRRAIKLNKKCSLDSMLLYKNEYHITKQYCKDNFDDIYKRNLLIELFKDLNEKHYKENGLFDKYYTPRFSLLVSFIHYNRLYDSEYPEVPVMFREAAIVDYLLDY